MTSDSENAGIGDQAGSWKIVSNESSFQKLQKRAFGGEDVAARPGAEDDEWWPKGPLLPGVQELTQDFVDSIDSPEGLHIVFLLGGAGNGKSYTARALGRQLGLSASSSDELAHRIYKAAKNGACIELLNDATIAPTADYHSRQSVALACDIQRWWRESATNPVSSFCCVNRGIIIDELRSLSEESQGFDDLPRAILTWLASPNFDVASELGASPEEPKLSLGEHYHELRFNIEGRPVRIAAISVDACSLMDAEGSQSRAGALFQQIVERCREDAMARPTECPIRSNVQQWLPPNTIEGWEKLLAHAEIASGRLHSYRDVWGLAALSILGPRFATIDGSRSLLDHVDHCLKTARDSASLEEKLGALLELSHFRVHNALFRAPVPTNEHGLPFYPPTTPAHLGLSLVDPSAWESMHSQTVEAAMQSVALGEMPSDYLLGHNLLKNVWFEFDKRLEKAIVEYVSSSDCSDSMRRQLISWLGAYLTRLVGISTGHLGNNVVIEQWERCREKCAAGAGKLPLKLEEAIRSLIFPQHDDAPQRSVLVPAFAARVEPLQSSRDGTSPRLAEIIPHSSIDLQLRKQGSRLLLECTRTGSSEVIGQLVLDFPLIREALACRGNRAGQTESTAHIEPRVERCRASSLDAVSFDQRRLVVVSGGSLTELN